MAGKIPVGDFNARTSLDGTQPIKTLAEMKRSVGALTNEWKAQVAQLKSTGNSLGAAEAKYNGLGKAIDQQKDYLEKLKREQKSVDQTTDEGSKAYSKLSNDIAKAETKIASLTSQQTRAKQSMDYYKSGLADAQSELKRISSVSDSYVKRLRAEGKETEANKKEIEGLKSAHSKMSEIYEKQVKEQAKIASSTGKSSEAYAKQTIRVNETAAKMATAEKRMNDLNDEIKKTNPSPFTKIKSALTGVNDKAEKTHSLFKTIFSANILSSAVSTVWGKLSSSIGSAKDAAMEYATAQQTMNATWLTLTGNAKEGKKMVDMTNEMAVAAANSTDMVDGMNQKFYAITKNADVTKDLTKSVLTLQDAFGATDDAVMNFSTQFAQMQANGKVSAQDMMSFVNTFPVLRTELLKTMQQQTHNSKLTMSQMNDLMSSGKISAKTMDEVLTGTAKKYSSATENFAKTVPGLSRTIKSQMPVLIGNITQPLLKLQNPVLGAVSNWITDPKTHTKFTELGNNFSKELNNVITAFTGKSGSGDAQKKLFDTLNGGVDKLNKGISVTFDYVSKHAGDIKGISSDLWTITKTIGASAWGVFKGTVKVVADMLGVGGKNAKTMKDPLETIHAILDKIAKNKDALEATGKVIAGIFIAKKALNFASGVSSVVSSLTGLTQIRIPSQLTNLFTKSPKANLGEAASGIDSITKAAGTGVTKAGLLGKALKGVGVAGLAISAIDVGGSIVKAFSSGKNSDKYKAAGKTAGTGIGAGIGAAIGSIVPGAGTLAGAGIGAAIGDALGSTKLAQSWAKKISKSLSGQSIEAPKISTKNSYNELTKASKKYYSEKQKQDKQDIELLKKNGLISDKEYQKRLKTIEEEGKKVSRLEKMSQSDRNAISKYYAQERQKLETKWNKQIRSDTGKWNAKISEDTMKYGANSIQVQRDIAKKNKAIKKDEADKIKALNSQKLKFSTTVTAKEAKLYTTLNGSIQRSSDKQVSILKKLTTNKGKLSNKQLQQAVNSSNTEYKKTVANAEKQYNKIAKTAEKQYQSVVKAAKRQRDGAKTAADDQYNKTVAAANRQYKGNSKWATEQRKKVTSEAATQRNKAKAAADKQYSDVVSKAESQKSKAISKAQEQKNKVAGHARDQYNKVKEQASKQSKNVVTHATNQANSSMRANKKQASGIHGIWKSIVDFFNGLTKPFGVKSVSLGKNTAGYTPVAMGAYATGKSISKAGKALVGEAGTEARYRPYSGSIDFIGTNGAEIVDVNPGDQILNATDTAKLLSGNYHSTLPGYAKGTFSIGNLLGTAQDKLSDIWESVSEKAQNAISKITHPIKTLKGIVSKAFNLDEQNIGSLPRNISKGMVNGVVSGAAKTIDNLKKKISDVIGDAGGGKGAPKGSGVQRWKGQLKKALKANGLPTTSAYVNAWLRQISSESGGNEKAMQHGYVDKNTITGDLAKGLLQTISATFNAYKFPGHGNIFNGYDNMLAAINYAKHTYGKTGMLQVIGHGHGYANGGLVGREQLAHVAEGNRPEMIIPLSSLKSSRGYELLGQTAAYFASRDNLQAVGSNDTQLVSMLAEKLDNIATLMMNLSFAVSVKLGDKDLAAELAEPVKAIIDQKARFENQWKRKI